MKEQAIKDLDALNGKDPEMAHVKADEILLDFLRASGMADVADAYERVNARAGGFWYA